MVARWVSEEASLAPTIITGGFQIWRLAVFVQGCRETQFCAAQFFERTLSST